MNQIPSLVLDAVRHYADLAIIYHAYVRGQPIEGKNIGVGYDSFPPGQDGQTTGRISVGIVSGQEYRPCFSVTGKFGSDVSKIFAAQTSNLEPNIAGLVRFFVHGMEKDFKPQ